MEQRTNTLTLLNDVLHPSSSSVEPRNISKPPLPPPPPQPPITNFELNVSKETFKFNAAHFVAYSGFRERLHGHNYRVSLRLLGARTICNDGYLLDFGDMKKVVKNVCRDLNEFFLCPVLSDVMQISVIKGECGDTTSSNGDDRDRIRHDTVKLVCEDGATFLFPLSDCAMLPIVHATTEELAVYLWGKVLTKLDVNYLRRKGIHTMEVTCTEAPGQDALFRMEIPPSSEDGGGGDGGGEEMGAEIARRSNVKGYLSSGDLFPRPCLPKATTAIQGTGADVPNSNMLRSVVPAGKGSPSEGEKGTVDPKMGCCANCSDNFSKQLQGLMIDATKKDGTGAGNDDSRDLLESISKIQKYINK